MGKKDAMTKIQIGDLVRIGDLPAGAVVRGDSGYYLRVGEQCVSGDVTLYRARAGESDPGCPCPADATMILVSLPPAAVDAAPVEESAAVAHWHTLAREAEAALYAMTAERDEWNAEALQTDTALDAARAALARVTAERDGFVAVLADTAKELDEARGEAADFANQLRRSPYSTASVERDAALARVDTLRTGVDQAREATEAWAARAAAAEAQVAALQEAAADNGRLRVAVAKICDALGMAQTPYQATSDGALLAIRDLRAECQAHAERTREARALLNDSANSHLVALRERDMARSLPRTEVAKICEALGMGEADDRTPYGALQYIVSLRRQLATWQDEGTSLYAALDLRDAQEGDRIAAWSDWAERPACVRCWYPATTHPHDEGLCHRCTDDDRDAAGAAEVAP